MKKKALKLENIDLDTCSTIYTILWLSIETNLKPNLWSSLWSNLHLSLRSSLGASLRSNIEEKRKQ